MLTALGLIMLGYLMGSIPTGYWLVKALKGVDVRTIGSGSTGATNVLRAAGMPAAVLVLLLDAAKGFAPVWLAIYLQGKGALSGFPLLHWQPAPPAVALAALVGHSKSVFLGFQGGKSAATGLGVLLALNPHVAVITFLLWAAVVWLTRFVSLASILAVWACALFMVIWQSPAAYVACCLLGAAYVTYRHKSNIQRLAAGKESRLGEKPGQAAAGAERTAGTACSALESGRADPAGQPPGSQERSH